MSEGSRPLDRHLREARATLESLHALGPILETAVELAAEALASGGKILACGNGGSAADADHFAGELVGRLVSDRRPYPGLALATSGAAATGIANDYGYDAVFARQVRGLGRPGDVLVVLSTSGRSPSVIRALETAGELGLRRVALLGGDGGDAAAIADCALTVPGTRVARIQEAHQLLVHVLCEQIEVRLE